MDLEEGMWKKTLRVRESERSTVRERVREKWKAKAKQEPQKTSMAAQEMNVLQCTFWFSFIRSTDSLRFGCACMCMAREKNITKKHRRFDDSYRKTYFGHWLRRIVYLRVFSIIFYVLCFSIFLAPSHYLYLYLSRFVFFCSVFAKCFNLYKHQNKATFQIH